MTTVQESPNRNGHHHLFPPPYSVPGLQDEDRGQDSTPNNAGAEPSALGSNQLPDRCQFFFSDGRQCTMARSDIHPSLCRFHAEREDQLFGEPSPAGYVVGAALDLPELYSACRDLTTAASVNRALTQVFRLLAQRRISRQEAATFGHLAQLLLRTISLMRAESADPTRFPGESPAANVYQSSRENHGDQELSRADKDELRGADKDQELSPVSKVQREPRVLPVPSPQPQNGASGRQPPTVNVTSPPPIAPAPSEPPAEPTAVKTSSGVNTGADVVCNSREISTCEKAEFKAVQNEHLHNDRVPSESPVRDETN